MTHLRDLARGVFVAALIAAPVGAIAQQGDLLASANGVEIAAGYAVSAGPAAPTGAAYMAITNTNAAPDRLIAIEGAAARRIELHAHVLEDGVAKMRRIDGGVTLAPGETVTLARGGLHVMLMGLTAPFEDGAAVDLVLVFETAGSIPVALPVTRDRPAPAAQQQH